MQNFGDISYLDSKKIIDIRSEVLFREAEDDFYYFSNINSALKKLKKAIFLTPNHTKSLVLCADIYFVKGNIKKALDLYKKADLLTVNNVRIIAAIANCHYSLKNYNEALKYAKTAIKYITLNDIALYSQILGLMAKIFTSLKNYKKAFEIYSEMKNFDSSFEEFYKSSYDFVNKKMKLQTKLNNSGLKIV